MILYLVMLILYNPYILHIKELGYLLRCFVYFFKNMPLISSNSSWLIVLIIYLLSSVHMKKFPLFPSDLLIRLRFLIGRRELKEKEKWNFYMNKLVIYYSIKSSSSKFSIFLNCCNTLGANSVNLTSIIPRLFTKSSSIFIFSSFM